MVLALPEPQSAQEELTSQPGRTVLFRWTCEKPDKTDNSVSDKNPVPQLIMQRTPPFLGTYMMMLKESLISLLKDFHFEMD